ncbi:hypothetical protein ACQKWADRAFT_282611 [Trichoderma austrokoningii]
MPPGNTSSFFFGMTQQREESPCFESESCHPCLSVLSMWRCIGEARAQSFASVKPRKQEADMHKSAFHCLSFWRAEQSLQPLLPALRRGAPQLRVNTATRVRISRHAVRGAKLKLPPLCYGPAPPYSPKSYAVLALLPCRWHYFGEENPDLAGRCVLLSTWAAATSAFWCKRPTNHLINWDQLQLLTPLCLGMAMGMFIAICPFV